MKDLLALLARGFARVSEFAQAKPAVLAATGSAGGFGAWLVTWADHFTRFCQLAGGFFGFLLAFVSFVLVLPKGLRFVRNWRAKGLLLADKE